MALFRDHPYLIFMFYKIEPCFNQSYKHRLGLFSHVAIQIHFGLFIGFADT